jgi:hypothetical protein
VYYELREGEPLAMEGSVGRIYGSFLKLPVPVVLAVLWVAGAVLEALCVIAVYEALVIVLL